MKNDSINKLLSRLKRETPGNFNLINDMVKNNSTNDPDTRMMITIGQKIIYANQNFCNTLKYECKQLRHADVMDLIPNEDQEILKIWIDRLVKKGSVKYMLRGYTGDGEQVWVNITSIYLNKHDISLSFLIKVGQIPTTYNSLN